MRYRGSTRSHRGILKRALVLSATLFFSAVVIIFIKYLYSPSNESSSGRTSRSDARVIRLSEPDLAPNLWIDLYSTRRGLETARFWDLTTEEGYLNQRDLLLRYEDGIVLAVLDTGIDLGATDLSYDCWDIKSGTIGAVGNVEGTEGKGALGVAEWVKFYSMRTDLEQSFERGEISKEEYEDEKAEIIGREDNLVRSHPLSSAELKVYQERNEISRIERALAAIEARGVNQLSEGKPLEFYLALISLLSGFSTIFFALTLHRRQERELKIKEREVRLREREVYLKEEERNLAILEFLTGLQQRIEAGAFH